MSKALLQKLLEIGVFQRGEFNLSAGGKSDFYFDIKKSYGYPEILSEIVSELWIKIVLEEKHSIACVAGIGIGGVPLASAISSHFPVRASYLREEEKSYGTKKIIEGYFPENGERVIIADDAFQTGKNILKARQIILNNTGARVARAAVVVNRNPHLKIDIPLTYLFTPEDFLTK